MACLLYEAGKDGIYIKLRTRWLSDCFQTYLRNTYTICAQHMAVLGGDNADILRKLALPNSTIAKDPVHSMELLKRIPSLTMRIDVFDCEKYV